MNNWVFNPNGGGYTTGQTIHEYLDFNGNSFIQLTATGGNSFSFREHSVFNIVQADSNGQLFPMSFPGGSVTATFEAVGTGTFGGSFTLSGGTIRMYQNGSNTGYASAQGVYGANQGIEIARFNVLSGNGLVDESGIPTSNGQVSVFAQAAPGMLAPGYFFNSAGKDLSSESILSFGFTNANTLARPSTTLVSELVCQYAGFTAGGCTEETYQNRPGEYFLLGTNGQFKLAEVPEPGSLALFGIALLAVGATARKRKALQK
jgi:hypothetical protein